MTPFGPRSPTRSISPRSHERRERRAIRAGLVLSVLFHLLLLLAYPAFTGYPDVRVPTGDTDPDATLREGLQLLDILEIADADLPQAPEPEPLPEEVPPEPEPVGPRFVELAADDVADLPVEGDDAEEPEEGLTLAERLQPRLGDPRIWAPIPAEFTELTEFERAEILLRGMIQTWNDSVAVAEALSDRARDWTYTDASGRRWGLGPGRLYLGDISIPLPAFEFAPGLIEDSLDRRATLADLARGAASEALRETWTDRARVIRERMEAERSPPPSRADEGGG